MEKHAADWAPEAPTPAQLKELFAQIASGRITKEKLQDILVSKKVEASVPVSLRNDKAKDGWMLLENIPFDGKQFVPELVEFLKSGESLVNGEAMKLRAKKLNAHLGQEHGEYLLEHQELIPTEWQGKYYLTFPGTVWQDSRGDRRVPSLDWGGARWCLGFYCLGDDWRSRARLVRPRG